nr:uncharacterized protein LOC102070474 [Zonotrichia albicollis]
MLKPPLRICEEGILLEKNTRFGVYFSVLPKHGGGGLQKAASQEADLERALKLNPQRRQPLEVGHSLELLSPLMPFLCGCERPRRRNRNTRCSKHCRGEGFPEMDIRKGSGFQKRAFWTSTGENADVQVKCPSLEAEAPPPLYLLWTCAGNLRLSMATGMNSTASTLSGL